MTAKAYHKQPEGEVLKYFALPNKQPRKMEVLLYNIIHESNYSMKMNLWKQQMFGICTW